MLSTAGNTLSSERLELGSEVGHCTVLDTERSQRLTFVKRVMKMRILKTMAMS
jgi:hypothetical protein